MPRQNRIDFPGALHHIMVRGIDRKPIFLDNADRSEFLKRLSESLKNTQTQCYAWAIMPNHLHLLLTTGKQPISRILQSILTGYALYFNRRYKRAGHLFQNRYKSILCERDEYFKELVRYIHLNPLRAGIVESMDALDKYPWSGHSVLMDRNEMFMQNCADVLGCFGNTIETARIAYRSFVEDGISRGRREDLVGGGLIRSLGGWKATLEARRNKEKHFGDERILGNSSFVEDVLAMADEKELSAGRLKREGWDANRIIEYVAEQTNTHKADLITNTKKRHVTRARSIVTAMFVDDLGMKSVDAAKVLHIDASSVTKSLDRGRRLIKEKGLKIEARGEGQREIVRGMA